ncbi:RNA polymerase sigma-70 factor, ECF subfamily [Cupriavidus sp. OV038]|jgi:RNA polymerase sigma-70 factor (ECF subfamily)|uniref:sigma-70 family RNA polymerase sigma factor n=1 Tax=unclassified Cupriavidus TaxID=2640874 RepID=UPI0008E32A34|nr:MULTISPECIES: sigma-70 family RNA polymerase sigma factor [unclassified Cupriavidus]SFC44147.1 RNA polymerase sigma-70 factor, ECF subfamily [Cupriavidus sp. OV038]SFP32750.1 RNA polymerase sigma-70 factor, ECF subfamily [Cupriavidus sp. OV096]
MERTTGQEALQRREARLRELFADGLAGDQAAYARFLTELAALLRGYFRHRLQQQAGDVEDLTQEVLLAVHNARHTYLPDQPLTAWVHAIARYKLADHFRAHARHDALSMPLDAAEDILATPDLESAQARRDLNLLLDQLPDRQRLPIVHVKLEGLSVSETARMTGLSESAVKVGVHRGLKALAAKIRGTK